MVTPNFDKFSESALTFHYAYTQQAICAPSRNAFMSGRRPDQTKVCVHFAVTDFRIIVNLSLKLNLFRIFGLGMEFYQSFS